ncbi:MAG TPA: peptidoglycan-binding protein [Candidatus Binatia bacterium]|nr:peptidoglycan-binding protein [Candidatus Binatia bacterium]
MTLVKAKLVPENDGDIEFLFNPDQITFRRTNGWSFRVANGTQQPAGAFSGGQSGKLSFTILLDSTEDSTAKETNVAVAVKKLIKLTHVDESLSNASGKTGRGHSQSPQHRPPTCKFLWGDYLSFDAVIDSLIVHYVLFLEDGTPVRANVDLSLTQIADEDTFPKQNPTSGGRTGERVHRLGPRETLDQVAWAEFGRPSLWRAIAAFNGIDDPLRLQAGDPILLPASVDDLKGFA